MTESKKFWAVEVFKGWEEAGNFTEPEEVWETVFEADTKEEATAWANARGLKDFHVGLDFKD